MSYIDAIILGIVQGLTEFLPVSSSGHLAITQSLLPGFSQPGVLFDVLVHSGTMMAVILYFRLELRRLLIAPFRQNAQAQEDRKILWLLVVATIPAAIIGLTFKDFFAGMFHNLTAVSVMLLITGTLLYFTENQERGHRKEGDMGVWDALLVGLAQSAAILPGISRSGSTIACLLLRKVESASAARFSFLMMLPAVGGATLLSLRELQAVPLNELPVYAVGTLVAFITGWLSIGLLMAVVRKKRLRWFAAYCWVVGGIFLVLSLR